MVEMADIDSKPTNGTVDGMVAVFAGDDTGRPSVHHEGHPEVHLVLHDLFTLEHDFLFHDPGLFQLLYGFGCLGNPLPDRIVEGLI